MYSPTPLTAASVGAVASVLIPYVLWRRRSSARIPLPPSPISYPLIGNILSMPRKEEHLGFIETAQQLNSNIFSLSMFGIVIVVLNNVEDAVNLLEKRSSIYSDRAQTAMLVDPSLMDWGNLVTSLSYGERWRKSRRMMHQWLHKQAAEEFHQSQQHQARLLLQRLLSKSDSLNTSEVLELEIYTTMAGTIMHSVYGLKVEDPSDTFMLKLKEAMDNIAKAALPSNFLVNSFPALIRVPDWFPWTDWKRLGREWREQKEDAVNGPFNWTKSEMEKSVHEPSMVESMLGQAEHLGIDSSEVDDYVKEVAFVLFG
ncbi:hypothetical protein FRC06_011150, partial [Ceratobasidium sp. 370]